MGRAVVLKVVAKLALSAHQIPLKHFKYSTLGIKYSKYSWRQTADECTSNTFARPQILGYSSNAATSCFWMSSENFPISMLGSIYELLLDLKANLHAATFSIIFHHFEKPPLQSSKWIAAKIMVLTTCTWPEGKLQHKQWPLLGKVHKWTHCWIQDGLLHCCVGSLDEKYCQELYVTTTSCKLYPFFLSTNSRLNLLHCRSIRKLQVQITSKSWICVHLVSREKASEANFGQEASTRFLFMATSHKSWCGF